MVCKGGSLTRSFVPRNARPNRFPGKRCRRSLRRATFCRNLRSRHRPSAASQLEQGPVRDKHYTGFPFDSPWRIRCTTCNPLLHNFPVPLTVPPRGRTAAKAARATEWMGVRALRSKLLMSVRMVQRKRFDAIILKSNVKSKLFQRLQKIRSRAPFLGKWTFAYLLPIVEIIGAPLNGINHSLNRRKLF